MYPITKIDLNDLNDLKNRNKSFRLVIENKKYDTSNEDDLCRKIINDDKCKDMLLIRYEYYISKSYHQFGKGDLVFWDYKNIYVVELKSLKDKYSNTTDKSKIEKCTEQAIKYAKLAKDWCGQEGIPYVIIEYNDDSITTEEKQIEINNNDLNIEYDKWFSRPDDMTRTKYKIVDDTLEIERIVDKEPSANMRKSFRHRAKKVATEHTKVKNYFIVMKNIEGDILMSELKNIYE